MPSLRTEGRRQACLFPVGRLAFEAVEGGAGWSGIVKALFFGAVECMLGGSMERAIPILPADDLAAAKGFYVNGLGFRVTFEATKDGRTGLMGLERGTIRLTIDSPMRGHGRNACVALEVDDADAYYREWSARVAVLRAPMDEAWGARTFDLLDPAGNTIFVMGPAVQ